MTSDNNNKGLSHINSAGFPIMVDVGEKAETSRTAIARGQVIFNSQTFHRLLSNDLPKGDVLKTAQIAGIMAAKKTSELIPMCHQLILTGVDLEFNFIEGQNAVEIFAKVKCNGVTGVEMEALTAVSVAALTIYDMCKAVQRDIVIDQIMLFSKTGGKSDYFNGD